MNSKQTKSVLLAAQVTPDFVERFDRTMKRIPGADTRSAALRFVVEQWVKDSEVPQVQTDGRITAQ